MSVRRQGSPTAPASGPGGGAATRRQPVRSATARELAAATPAHRDRYIDMLRAVSICVVVFGHWTIWAVTADDEGIGSVNLLSVAPWTHPLTWLFQVMPVFFLVGGYANAASLDARRRKGGTVAGWVRQRALRLLRPSAVLLAVLLVVRVVAVALGADEELVRDAIWAATGPLWFLVVYLAVVALAPLAEAAHRRWGLRAAVALAISVLIGDVLRIASGEAGPAAANYLLAWLAVHQLGVAWHAGDLPRTRSAAWAWVATGLGAGMLLVGPGPYGVPMVGGAPAPDLTNTAPPTIALLALATAQTGAVLLLRRRASAWLATPRVWTAVVALNGRILTVFLWHMATLVMVGVTLAGIGLFPTPPVGSAQWFALRIPWLVVLSFVLAGLVALFGRWETPPRTDPQERPSPWAVALGVVAVFAGLASLGVSDTRGVAPPVAGIPVVEVAVIAGGLVLLRSGGRSHQPDHGEVHR